MLVANEALLDLMEAANAEQYMRFINGQIERAEVRAAQLGYLQPVEKPSDIKDLEEYLQELLGYIALNHLVDEYYSY